MYIIICKWKKYGLIDTRLLTWILCEDPEAKPKQRKKWSSKILVQNGLEPQVSTFWKLFSCYTETEFFRDYQYDKIKVGTG